VTEAFTNEGTLDLEANAAANFNGGNSSGTISLAAGSKLGLAGNNSAFTLLAGAAVQLAQNSELDVNGPLTQQAATVTLAAGSLINDSPGFASGGYTLADGASVSGAGVVQVGGFSGQMTVTGSATIDNLALSSGTITINAPGALEVQTFTQTGGTLTGSGTLTIDSQWTWTGGTMSGGTGNTGTTVNKGKATVGGGFGGPQLSGRTVNNLGTVSIPDGDSLTLASTAVWNNLAGSTLKLEGTAALGSGFGSPGTLHNAGTLVKEGADSATSNISVPFDNTGTVRVKTGGLNVTGAFTNEGTLALRPNASASVNGGNSSGTIRVGAGSKLGLAGNNTAFTLLAGAVVHLAQNSELDVNGPLTQQAATVTLAAGSLINVGPGFNGNYTLADGASVSGAGIVQVGGFFTQMNVTGSASVSNLILTNDTITITAPGALEVQTFTQTGGTLTGSGTLTIDNQWTWTGGTMSGGTGGTGTTVLNGTATLGNGPFGTTLSGRTVNNFGTATLPNGDLISFQSNAVWNNEAGGVLELGEGSSLGNFFGSSGSFTNAGEVIVHIGGTSASQFGQIQLSGTATLGGTLTVVLDNGFTPVAGNSFRIVSAGSRSGTFATVNFPDLGPGLAFAANYDATGLTLAVVTSS
jgi:hypothetical protein